MITIGRLCIKTAGRDAMQYCVVVEELDEKYVMVDGNTRRKKVNKIHLEPLEKIFDLKKGADTKTIFDIFKKEGIEIKKSVEPKPKKEKKEQIKKVSVKKTTDKKKSKKE